MTARAYRPATARERAREGNALDARSGNALALGNGLATLAYPTARRGHEGPRDGPTPSTMTARARRPRRPATARERARERAAGG